MDQLREDFLTLARAHDAREGPTANLPPTAVGYCVRRSHTPLGLIMCVVRPTGPRILHLTYRPHRNHPQPLAAATLLHNSTSPRPSLLIPAPTTQPGAWDQFIDAWNQHLTTRTTPQRHAALTTGIGTHRAHHAARLLADQTGTPSRLHLDVPDHTPRQPTVAVAQCTYHHQGHTQATGALLWHDGTLVIHHLPPQDPPLTPYAAAAQLAHQAIRLNHAWALDPPVLLLPAPHSLTTDLHAVTTAGEHPTIVTAIRGAHHTTDLANLATALHHHHAHLRPPTPGWETDLTHHATTTAHAAAGHPPAPLDAPVPRYRDFTPTPTQRKALKALRTAEATAHTLTGRPTIAVDASLQPPRTACAVVLPHHTLTADLTTTHPQHPLDINTAETLALLLALTLAPPHAVIYTDSQYALTAWHTNNWTCLPHTPPVTELLNRAQPRTDCHVVWRRRQSTPRLTQADNAANTAAAPTARRPPPLQDLLQMLRHHQR